MSTILGVSGSEKTLDDPFSCSARPIRIEEFRRMADGSATRDHIADKWQWRVAWRNLPLGGANSGRTEIYTEASRTGVLNWSPPDRDSGYYTVLSRDYNEDLVNVGGEEYYSITLVLEEQ